MNPILCKICLIVLAVLAGLIASNLTDKPSPWEIVCLGLGLGGFLCFGLIVGFILQK